MDFNKLKQKSKTGLSDIQKKLEEEQTKKVYDNNDDEYWMPTIDKKTGAGSAVIRFLPAPPQDGEDALPWVKYWRHSFQGPGGWYIEKSRTTLGEPDPCTESNTKLWETGIKENRDIASKRKRKLTYESNIEIISDPAKPELKGAIKKYKYGTKIFEKIEKAMAGDPGDEVTPAVEGFDPFDFWNGAVFRIVIKRQGEHPNYDDSKFGPPTPHHGGDEAKLKEIWNKEYSLKEVVLPEKFKSYDELKTRLDKALGMSSSTNEVPKTVETTKLIEQARKATAVASKDDETPPWEPSDTSETLDEDLAYFQRLAKEV